MKNNIRKIRLRKNMSMEALAIKINTTAPQINKLEKGIVGLNVKWIERIASGLGVDPAEVLGIDVKPIIINELDIINSEDNFLQIPLNDHSKVFSINSNSLDELGIIPGDLLIFDCSKKAINDLQNNDVIYCTLSSEDNNQPPLRLARQFIKPSLLITNSATENLHPINCKNGNATISGVMISSHRVIKK